MTPLILHIGTQKTGSKALQHALVAACGTEFAYPSRQRLWHRHIHDALLKGDAGPLRAALAEIESSGAPVGVLSYEGFHELPDAALDLLAGEAGEATVVIFLRRQEDVIDSMINQTWKAHRRSYASALAQEERYLDDPNVMDYELKLSRLAQRFARVIPRIYVKGVSVVASFAEATKLPLSEPEEGTADPNPAATAVELATLREVKRRAGEHPRLRDIVEATRQAMARPGLGRLLASRRDAPARMLDPEMRACLAERYAASNARVAARWFPDVVSGGQLLFPPAVEVSPAVQVSPSAQVLPPAPARPRLGIVRQISGQFDLPRR